MALTATPGAVLLLAVMVMAAGIGDTCWLLLGALIHEAGHMAAAIMRGARISRVTASPGGFIMDIEGTTSYADDIVIAAAGPAAGLASMALVRALGLPVPDVFLGSGLLYSVFNLLPLSVLDGGRVMTAAISLFWGPDAAWWVAKRTDQALCALLFGLGSVLLVNCANPSLALMTIYVYDLCCKNRRCGVKSGWEKI